MRHKIHSGIGILSLRTTLTHHYLLSVSTEKHGNAMHYLVVVDFSLDYNGSFATNMPSIIKHTFYVCMYKDNGV